MESFNNNISYAYAYLHGHNFFLKKKVSFQKKSIFCQLRIMEKVTKISIISNDQMDNVLGILFSTYPV